MLERLVPTMSDLHALLPTEHATPGVPVDEMLSDQDAMEESLERFTAYMNAGPLDALIASHPRSPQRSFPHFSLKLHSFIGERGYTKMPDCNGKFWPDAPYTLGLSYQHKEAKNPTTVIIAGFMGKQTLLRVNSRIRAIEDPDQTDALVVVQLQGVHSKNIRRNNVSRNIIRAIQWEDIMMTSVEAYADQLGVKQIAILAARKNRWFPEEEFLKHVTKDAVLQRRTGMIMHYDVTAKKRGYSIDKHFVHSKMLFE